MKNRFSNKINKILDLPIEVANGETKITIIGFNDMLIENYQGILEYEEFYIKVKIDIGSLNVSGYKLSLEQVTEDDILVKGKIKSLDIERILEEGET